MKCVGYKCVKFWECNDDGNIMDSSDHFGGGLDIRFNNKRPKESPGGFDPYSKQCDDNFEVCCKGKCQADKLREIKTSEQTTSQGATSNSFCPSDFTGSNLNS